VAGQQFHVVQTLQLLVGMIGEYLAFRDAVPAFGADVAQRVLELLKVFNSRSCQLVLGAGAMQVSGLKSITAKHLAVCCQCVSALAALHPALAGALLQGVPRPRGDMLAAGFARALQDLNIHADEIRGKLVGMMHERLAANVKQLPVLAASWPAAAAQPAAGPPPPSSFAATTVKQLQILAGVLSPLMQPAEVRAILGSIGGMFASALAEAYDDLQPRGGGWDAQMLADLECFLSCLRELPMEAADREANLAQLAGMYQHRLRHAAAAAAEQQQQTQQQQKAQREASPPPPPRPPTAPPAGAAPQPSVAPPPPRAAEPVEPAAAQPQRGESGAHPLAEPAAAVLETEPEPEPERIEEAPATNGPAGSRPQEAAVASSPEPDDDDLGFADVDLTAS
jgi:vacuolar protein sorting-associated protein 54